MTNLKTTVLAVGITLLLLSGFTALLGELSTTQSSVYSILTHRQGRK